MKLYCDLIMNGEVIFTGAVCLNCVVISNYTYLGLQGGLCFYDSQGSSDPTSPGLGTHFILAYVSPTGGLFQIPIQDVYNQQFDVVLNGNQNCTISLYQR